MAQQLKHFFSPALVRELAAELHAVHQRLDRAAFVRDGTRGLAGLELLARGEQLAAVMRAHLPQDFEEALSRLVRSLGPELPGSEGNGMAPFRYLPHTMFVARHGLDHFEPSMRALHALTRRFTAESAIRPFLLRHEQRTLAQLARWVDDPSEHVRRLVSEGTRPRLPWAQRLPAFQRAPAPVLALLERLKDDPSLYVRRSVANNLNDIGKDHPALLVRTCARWWRGADEERRWLVRHALRSLVKQGDRGALEILGVHGRPQLRLEEPRLLPARTTIGGETTLACTLLSTAQKPQELLVDFAVHYVKASGVARPKVFKLRRLVLAPGEAVQLRKRISFVERSTRRHHPGPHRVVLLVNGVEFPLGTVVLGLS